MPKYVAFLRGVSPLNAKMPELKRCFEAAGFTEVKTVLASGNVVFSAHSGSEALLARRIEAAMEKNLDRVFSTLVRSVDDLKNILEADPFQAFRLKPGMKRVVTFLREKPGSTFKLPIRKEGASILKVDGATVFSAYEPNPKGPVFMSLIEKTFGKDVTTRTWDTITKVVR